MGALAGGRGPAFRGAEKKLPTPSAGHLLGGLKVSGALRAVDHVVPPSLSADILLGIQINNEDTVRTLAGDQPHVVTADMLSAWAIPTQKGEVRRQLVLERNPFDKWPLPLRGGF